MIAVNDHLKNYVCGIPKENKSSLTIKNTFKKTIKFSKKQA